MLKKHAHVLVFFLNIDDACAAKPERKKNTRNISENYI